MWGTWFFFLLSLYISGPSVVDMTERPIGVTHYHPASHYSHVYVRNPGSQPGPEKRKYTRQRRWPRLSFSPVTRQAFHRTTLAYAIVNLELIVLGRSCAKPLADSPTH